MSKFNLYICDDAIPSFGDGALMRDQDVVPHQILEKILQDGSYTWAEPEVKNLAASAIKNESWSIRAARNPEFFINEILGGLDRPDILVFDWDYPGLIDGNSADYLYEFLGKTYCIIQIYSGAEKRAEIQAVIDGARFAPFRSRILAIAEKKQVTADALLGTVLAQHESNLSYKFGYALRKMTLSALDEILVDFGKISIKELMVLLDAEPDAEGDFKETLISNLRSKLMADERIRAAFAGQAGVAENAHHYIDIVADKLRDALNAADLQLVVPNSGAQESSELQKAAEMFWSRRLYYKPSDKIVRRGDIVYASATDDYFVVVSGDCDLAQFWFKNCGHINLIPLFKLDKGSTKLLDRFKLRSVTKEKAKFDTQSLINSPDKFYDGCLVVPLVPLASGGQDFMAFPKEITSVSIPVPVVTGKTPEQVYKSRLRYDHFVGYECKCSINAPFLDAFIQKLLNSISGAGVPDYSKFIRAPLNIRGKTIFTS